MNTEQTWQIESTSLENTSEIAKRLGGRLRGGETIELVSDLGGGKTAFVKGLAEGMGSPDTVTSPSFTLSNQYRAGKLTLYHFDFYRLQEPGILQDELAEFISDSQAVVVIEWADIIEGVLPVDHIVVQITVTGENSRKIICMYPKSTDYLNINT